MIDVVSRPKMVMPLKQAIIKILGYKHTTAKQLSLPVITCMYIAKKQELTGVVNTSKEKLLNLFKNMIQGKHRMWHPVS